MDYAVRVTIHQSIRLRWRRSTEHRIGADSQNALFSPQREVPLELDLGLNLRILVFLLLAAVVTGVLFGRARR